MTQDSPLSRRAFVRLSAATAGALALPGNAYADVSNGAFDAEYEFVQNHTPTDHAVPTLVTFTDASGPETLAATLDTTVITTAEPQPAAYAQLTTAQAVTAAELPTAETLSHSPGSNPFWRLGYYPFGVFPEPERSVEFVDYEQMIDGLYHLESKHADRMRFYSIGQSPGHYNEVSARDDPKDVMVAEVTNDVGDEAAFREKEKVFYSLSLHGLERAGAEAGSRFIERLLRGNEPEIERLLDDVVLVFCYTNPDGWVAKHPQYESGWQVAGPDGGAPVAPFYERGNAGVYDTNRQYPTVGWITTAHFPAEPLDPADRSLDRVPDTLAIVEHFRTYENLNYGADMHGALTTPQFVLGLISQDQYDSRQLHELYEMNRAIDATLEDALETWVAAGDAKQELLGDAQIAPLGFGALPEEAFDYAGIWDTIGYTVSGAMGDWMAHPPVTDADGDVVGGGLGMTTMDFEMAYSHMVGANAYNPELVRMQVVGYQTAIRTIARFAVENSDTPTTGDDFGVEVDAGGDRVAYVTTDTLTRSSEDLSFLNRDGEQDGDTARLSFSGTVAAGGPSPANTTSEHTVSADAFEGTPGLVEAELSWTPEAEDLEFVLRADGELAGEARTANNPERFRTVLPNDWEELTFVAESYAAAGAQYDIAAAFPEATLSSDAGTDSGSGGAAGGETTTASVVLPTDVEGLESTAETYTVPDGQHSLTAHVHAHEALLSTRLVDPDGTVVREFDARGDDGDGDDGDYDDGGRLGGRCCGQEEWHVADPAPGEWTVEVENLLEEPAGLRVQFGTLASTGPNPDPRPALGYDQTPYEVSPLAFFEDLAPYVTDGAVEPVTVDDVANGALAEYDHAVVIHADGAGDPAYRDALDAFVEDGGNLVLTDNGVTLLGDLGNDLAANVPPDGISQSRFYIAHLDDKDLDHPLMSGEAGEPVREIQQSLWKIAPLGYSTSIEAPMTLLAREAFESAGGVPSVAATTDGRVAAGSITRGETDDTGIHVVSSLLPPALQTNLHPFGLLDYTTSFLGYLVLTNALGFEQVRSTADGTVRFGRTDWHAEGPSLPAFTATGSRSDDGDAFTGGQTNQVSVTLDELTEVGGATVRDRVPANWTVLTEHSPDVERVAENDDGSTTVVFGAVGADDLPQTFTYFVEAPSGLAESDVDTFGPATAVVADPDAAGVRNATAAFGGTDDNTVVGADTSL